MSYRRKMVDAKWLWFAFLMVFFVPLAAAGESNQPPKTADTATVTIGPKAESEEVRLLDSGPVLRIDISGPITPAVDDYLQGALERAASRKARLLLITLNTPGGVLTSTQSMTEQLLAAPVPTAVYVSPSGGSATSAGVFVTLAANFAVMAPGTTIGAAHPVSGEGKDIEGDMRKKVENFAASLMKAIAEQRGRNVAWAERAVRDSVSITDREAVEQQVVDLTAPDVASLLKSLEERVAIVQGKTVKLVGVGSETPEQVPMSLKQRVVHLLSDPNVAVVIGLLAMLGLGVELYNPGLIFPGVVGVICVVLSLVAAQAVPIDVGGAALLLLAAIFFGVEMFMPTFGIWGGAGIVCLVLGAIYLVDAEAVWSVSGFEVDLVMVSGVALFVGAILLGSALLAARSRNQGREVGKEALEGALATVREELSSGGVARVFVNGEYWRARLESALVDGEKVPIGAKVRIVRVDPDLTLVVERVSV